MSVKFRELFVVRHPRIGVLRIGWWPGSRGANFCAKRLRDRDGRYGLALGVWGLFCVLKRANKRVAPAAAAPVQVTCGRD